MCRANKLMSLCSSCSLAPRYEQFTPANLLQAVDDRGAIAAAKLDDRVAVPVRAQQQPVDALAVEVALLVADEDVMLRKLDLPAGPHGSG